MGRFDYSRYVSMTMEFRCNLKCQHCMIEGTMDTLAPQTEKQLDEILLHNLRHRQWDGLILTGSEITLHRELPNWARRAREHGFSHVRIQTHGMRLSNRDYLEELIAAGVDEFFVSIAGGDAATHDLITCVPGSFDKSVGGLELIEEYDNVTSITNTVVTELSYRQLPLLVERLSRLKKLAQMEFWCYWPMVEQGDKRGLIAAHPDVLPYLRDAIHAARALDRGVEVKNFPECMLGDDHDALDNDQPKLYIDPAFWDQFSRNGFHHCVHKDQCASTECLGLNSAYVQKFGEHADLLKPYPKLSPENKAPAARPRRIISITQG